jgi:hypothetical protein
MILIFQQLFTFFKVCCSIKVVKYFIVQANGLVYYFTHFWEKISLQFGIIEMKKAWLRWIVSIPGLDLIKLFLCKYTPSFCKLGHFVIVNNIFIFPKWSQFLKMWVSLLQNLSQWDCLLWPVLQKITTVNDVSRANSEWRHNLEPR